MLLQLFMHLPQTSEAQQQQASLLLCSDVAKELFDSDKAFPPRNCSYQCSCITSSAPRLLQKLGVLVAYL